MKQYVWVIAYIDSDLIGKIPSELQKNKSYKNIEYQIPTVAVLKKQLKGKDHFKQVPLLFNYGFFKLPLDWALNIDLLNKVKGDISCISNWVKDRASKGGPKKDDEAEEWRYELGIRDVPIATVSIEAIQLCCNIADELSIFSSEDINRLKEGDIVHLMGYPFEGMKAKVVEINTKSKKVKVLLANALEEEETFEMKVEVHFDNIFYSLYQGSHNENYNQETLLEDYQLTRKKKPNSYSDEF